MRCECCERRRHSSPCVPGDANSMRLCKKCKTRCMGSGIQNCYGRFEMDHIELDEFLDRGDVQKNHLDTRASYDGFLFETYGEEKAYVLSLPEERVFTLIDDEDGQYVLPGVRLVNRLGFFVVE